MTSPQGALPRCQICNENLTIKHIISECTKYRREREKHMKEKTFKEVLSENEKFSAPAIYKYLKDIKIYDKI